VRIGFPFFPLTTCSWILKQLKTGSPTLPTLEHTGATFPFPSLLPQNTAPVRLQAYVEAGVFFSTLETHSGDLDAFVAAVLHRTCLDLAYTGLTSSLCPDNIIRINCACLSKQAVPLPFIHCHYWLNSLGVTGNVSAFIPSYPKSPFRPIASLSFS